MNARSKPVRKAVLPSAGLGTRFLPATKAIPKEMLALVDKPLIQYAVEECVASGIEDVVLVTSRGKSAMEDHFDRAPELESFLESKGKASLAEAMRRLAGLARLRSVRQQEPLGLGHAVLQARDLVGDEPFAVLLGDVVMTGPQPATRQLVEIYEATGDGAIAAAPVPREQVSLYGIIDHDPPIERDGRQLYRIRDLVEKPAPDEAPSTLSIVGRYLLPPEIFGYLERTKPGRGGEIQLTDALRQLARERTLWAYVCQGKAYDAGDKLGFLEATVELALADGELGSSFRAWLRDLKI